jgi:hypothetical protein
LITIDFRGDLLLANRRFFSPPQFLLRRTFVQAKRSAGYAGGAFIIT